MLQKMFATGLLCACMYPAATQENAVALNTSPPTAVTGEPPPVEPAKKTALHITGSADLYYRYGFEKSNLNNKTSFTNTHNSFALGMASVKLEHAGHRVGVVADLGFGDRAKEFSYNETGLLSAVKQLYVTYQPTEWLRFTGGTWATHVGYELADAYMNRNYSMSYMFTNGPFTHTGMKADATFGRHSLMLGITNATDYRLQPRGHINKKFVIAQYSYTAGDKVKLYLNYVGGQAPDTGKVRQADVVVTATLSPKLSLGFNATDKKVLAWDGGSKTNMRGEDWRGAALYVDYDPQSWLGLTLRSEFFNNKKLPLTDGNGNGFKTSLFANTISAGFRVDGFTFMPEVRVETAADPVFAGRNGLINKKSAFSVLMAVICHF